MANSQSVSHSRHPTLHRAHIMRIPLVTTFSSLLLSQLYEPPTPAPPKEISFTARHAHAHTPAGALYLHAGVPGSASALAGATGGEETFNTDGPYDAPLTLRTRKQTIRRPRVRPPHMLSWARAVRARRDGFSANYTGWALPDADDSFDAGEWDDVQVEAPDVTDRQTLLNLAKMASNAYFEQDADGWYPVPGTNHSTPVGWEPDDDGLRGYIVSIGMRCGNTH